MEDINNTFITLIPKVNNAENITQYRPISLCNVFYKIISKILANRIKNVIDDLISANQGAFIRNRNITDNIMITDEILRFMRLNKNEEYHMTIKIDMSKTYDRVEYKFLEKLLEKMDFNQRWIAWIMKCITTVSYKILVNGSPGNKIIPTRGLRQGDPISPYLFILCMEGLSLSLKMIEDKGNIE